VLRRHTKTVLIATITLANCANGIKEKERRECFLWTNRMRWMMRACEIYNQFDVDIMIIALFWICGLSWCWWFNKSHQYKHTKMTICHKRLYSVYSAVVNLLCGAQVTVEKWLDIDYLRELLYAWRLLISHICMSARLAKQLTHDRCSLRYQLANPK
jgi:hypothetical protein